MKFSIHYFFKIGIEKNTQNKNEVDLKDFYIFIIQNENQTERINRILDDLENLDQVDKVS